jgi:hypothetical protein
MKDVSGLAGDSLVWLLKCTVVENQLHRPSAQRLLITQHENGSTMNSRVLIALTVARIVGSETGSTVMTNDIQAWADGVPAPENRY